jgi:4'-phosphopantetheinyl transferase
VRVATVDLWRVCLNRRLDQEDSLWDCLHQDERARASRFHFRRDRDRFVASRGSLRHILARYLGQPPERIRLGYTAAGKPFLRDHPELHFNLSHAADLALVGVSHGGPLGVDIEEIQSNPVVDSTSRLVLSHKEKEALRQLSGQARCERFAQFWTRKEAYIKADGRGMQLPLDRIDVATSRDRVLLREHGSNHWTSCPRWTLRAVPVDPGYAAAIAAEGSDWEVRLAAQQDRPSQEGLWSYPTD